MRADCGIREDTRRDAESACGTILTTEPNREQESPHVQE